MCLRCRGCAFAHYDIRQAVIYSAAMSAPIDASSRLHIVFVPGFGGFDVLGPIEYYAGTTEVFRDWVTDAHVSWGDRIAVHYFDNLPSAAVVTRAKRLRAFLTKRMMRREFRPQDRVALIGHSTGGLDIRQLLLDLSREGAAQLQVRGIEDLQARTRPTGGDVLDLIAKVVFISVPQRGTNLANWARANEDVRKILVGTLRFLVDASDTKVVEPLAVSATAVVEQLRNYVRGQAPDLLPGLWQAVLDINAELALRVSSDGSHAADGREALADLELWLSNTDGDFLAQDDLACDERSGRWERVGATALKIFHAAAAAVSAPQAQPSSHPTKLARSTDDERAQEQQLWDAHRIAVRSYATVAPSPFPGLTRTEDALRSSLEVGLHAARPSPDTDSTYQLVYAACSSGPFTHALHERRAMPIFGGQRREIAAYENDGIVNTASMLWPNGDDTFLVRADHADIIGHFANDEAPQGREGRKRYRYDLLQSHSGFTQDDFTNVWRHIFEFVCS